MMLVREVMFMKNQQEKLKLPACSCMTLTSREGHHYWFRTCDIEEKLWEGGTHIVQYGAGSQIVYEDGNMETGMYGFLGITYNEKDSWLLDGVNEEGLSGGLLMLYEGTSVKKAPCGKKGYSGMEFVTKILSSCSTVKEVIALSEHIRILDIPYENIKVAATMHYFFVDNLGDEVILEATEKKEMGRLRIYKKEEIIGVMTNSPPYYKQLQNLSWFMSKSPELTQGVEGQAVRELIFDNRKVEADEVAEHVSLNGIFPASYASYDRFIRLAVMKALNYSGNLWEDDKILAMGSGIMNVVMEPDTKGIFHYSGMEENGIVQGQKESFTQYIVMYDLENKCFYMKALDVVSWRKYQLRTMGRGEKESYEISHDHMQGVIQENGYSQGFEKEKV